MIATFTCNAWQTITMMNDTAQLLLNIMGYQEDAPSGVILPSDIPDARKRLEKAVAQHKPQRGYDDSPEPTIGLAQRAFPLIEMLTAAEKEECAVYWQVSG